MNEKGEATLFSVLILVALTGLFTLCGLRLQHSYALLKRRTQLFLCVKEAKGETKRYLTFMGRTNWALKNTSRAQLVAAFIPGLQGAAVSAPKLKRFLKTLQDIELVAFQKNLLLLRRSGCPLDPRMLQTPFRLGLRGHERNADDTAKLRSPKWTWIFLNKPYALSLAGEMTSLNKITPRIRLSARENGATLSYLSSSR